MRHIESDLQRLCVTWFRLAYPKLTKLLFAVPNGGYRNAIEAKRMKLEGIIPGVSDLILLIASEGYSSLCIEVKIQKGRQSTLQKEWQKEAEKAGNKYVVVRSLDDFQREIENYLG